MTDSHPSPTTAGLSLERMRLKNLLEARQVLVLSGAGCSTDSGIPDYRGLQGEWKRKEPVRYQEFVRSVAARRRYWARSFAGWPQMALARPNGAHRALAWLEQQGYVRSVITQNVDGLHHKAGSRDVLELHGCINRVVCLSCRFAYARAAFQECLEQLNPTWNSTSVPAAPDGDADLEAAEFSRFRFPDCPSCGGTLKPDVVFFGESVPASTVNAAFRSVQNARALLVIGSSLMVWSGFRFARAAKQKGLPVAAVNLGRTRADDLLDVKIEARCGEVLADLVEQLRR